MNRQQVERKALRERILKEYGCKCACCGETEPEFLVMDHISGNGAEHCRSIPGGRAYLYEWLEKNGYPKDNYQLLCWNCNQSKGTTSSCVHKRHLVKND
jgi:hypothetical protein